MCDSRQSLAEGYRYLRATRLDNLPLGEAASPRLPPACPRQVFFENKSEFFEHATGIIRSWTSIKAAPSLVATTKKPSQGGRQAMEWHSIFELLMRLAGLI